MIKDKDNETFDRKFYRRKGIYLLFLLLPQTKKLLVPLPKLLFETIKDSVKFIYNFCVFFLNSKQFFVIPFTYER